MFRNLVFALLLAASAAAQANAQPPAATEPATTESGTTPVEKVEPAAPEAPPAPRVTITADWSESPDLEAWAKAARDRCEVWHPLIERVLGREGPPVHREIRIVLKEEMRGVAAASGAIIRVSSDYVRRHPEDDGMIVHELVHVVQAYPNPNPGWLAEGIADYVRYWHYEPGRRAFPIRRGRSSYREAYGTAARFLAWVQVAKDEKIVLKLDEAMRLGKYRGELFEEATGTPLDPLWDEFVEATARRRREPEPTSE